MIRNLKLNNNAAEVTPALAGRGAAQPLDGLTPALRFADFPTTEGAASEFHIRTALDAAASPDAFSRTPLFGASETRRTLLHPGEEIVVVNDADGYQVMLCGGLRSRIAGPYGFDDQVVSSRFDQTDYTVFLGLLRYVGGRLGARVTFEPYAFVRSLGLADTRENVLTAFASIARMSETRLAVRLPDAVHRGHFDYIVGRLVSGIGYSSSSRQYTISLDSQLAALFKPGNFSSVQWSNRLAIKGNLARWLHAELTSHASGRFRWTHKLQESYGARSLPRVFKARLKTAAEEVAKVTGWDILFEKNTSNSNEKLLCIKARSTAFKELHMSASIEVPATKEHSLIAAMRLRGD